MESVYFINLTLIFVLNVFFFFSGVCLNPVVIISFCNFEKNLLFHNNGFVLLLDSSYCNVADDWKVGCKRYMVSSRPLVAKVSIIFLALSLLAILADLNRGRGRQRRCENAFLPIYGYGTLF